MTFSATIRSYVDATKYKLAPFNQPVCVAADPNP
jgi:hypothetical protein